MLAPLLAGTERTEQERPTARSDHFQNWRHQSPTSHRRSRLAWRDLAAFRVAVGTRRGTEDRLASVTISLLQSSRSSPCNLPACPLALNHRLTTNQTGGSTMAQYKITATIKTATKAPRRGEREALRYRLLSLMNHESISQAPRRSLKVKRVV